MITTFTAIPIKMTMSAMRFLGDDMGQPYRSTGVASIRFEPGS